MIKLQTLQAAFDGVEDVLPGGVSEIDGPGDPASNLAVKTLLVQETKILRVCSADPNV